MKTRTTPLRNRAVKLASVSAAGLLFAGSPVDAVTLKSGTMSSGSTSVSSSSTTRSANANATTSQTATAATTATAQAAQTADLALNAKNALQHSVQYLQAQQASQAAARAAALTLPTSVANGLVIGTPANGLVSGLVPQGGIPTVISTTTSASGTTTTYATPGSWSGVGNNGVGGLSQTVTTSASAPVVKDTITQTQQQALLYWDSFNIGQNTTLNFDQSAAGANAAQWVAINKVAANIAPSQILGSITAQGQVYVINQNGIIFGGGSQVNVGALVASSLPINDNLVARGLLNNPDEQFLFSQSNIAAGTQGPTAAFTPEQNSPAPTGGMVAQVDAAGGVSLVHASGHDGDVAIKAGAQLTSPASAENVGGKIALVGSNVANAGTISTPDGQTILAAGNQVGFVAHNSNDPTLRGLDVYVGGVDSSSGTALNAGLIDSPEADITLTGKNVVQNGVINSSTSVALNGRIDLLADYGTTVIIPPGTSTPVVVPTSTDGTVTLGAGSLTQILPELSSTDTVVGSQLALSSLVNVQGGSIALAQDALLYAPSASTPSDTTKPALGIGGLTLSSGVTLDAGSWLSYNNTYSFFNTSGQISLAQGADIDVSGSQNVQASVTENIVSAQLLGTELADAPLQQNGALRGQTINVDLRQTGVNADGTTWIGTPVADVSGYVNLVAYTVGELTTKGGTVSLSAGQSVNLAADSTINVSGGWINYQGGMVETTKVVSGGLVYDISQATPDRVYDGIYTGYTSSSAKWGITQTYANSLVTKAQYQAGYIQGGSGGGLAISAPTLAVNGNLFGNSVAGAYQRTLASQLSTTYAGSSFLPTVLATQAVPQAAQLTLSFEGQNPLLTGLYLTYSHPLSQAPVDVVFQSATGTPVTDPFASTGNSEFDLSADLVNKDGFGQLKINDGDGNIFVPAGVSVATAAGGSIELNAANIDIEGSLTAAGGALTLRAYDYSPYADSTSPYTGQPLIFTPSPDATRGTVTLGSTASLSVAGLIVDDRATASAPGSLPLVTKGGTLIIDGFNAFLATGSSLNVSGGVAVNGANKVAYGTGGALSIFAGIDPNLTGLFGGQLSLESSLQGYSGSTGGSLTIQAPLIQVGGVKIDPVNSLVLSPDFFSQGGFSNFTLNGQGEVDPANTSNFLPAISIAAGVTINPTAQNWLASLTNNGVVLTTATYSLASERTPVSLTFGATGSSDGSIRGDFVLGNGAVIETDPKGNISISGNTVDILGDIIAPGGNITIKGATKSSGLGFSNTFDPVVSVYLGSSSLLSTSGVVELTPNAYGYTTGSVLAGGKISVTGNILADTGSVLNVSGASGVLDVSPTQAGVIGNQLQSAPMIATRIDSNGGSIILAGGQELVSAAQLLGGAGGPTAVGGSLTVSSQFFDPSQGNIATTPLQPNLEVTQGEVSFAASGLGNTILINGAPAGLGYFSADSFNTSGLASLTLAGTVQFSGQVNITASNSITVGSSGIILMDPSANNSALTLTAPYVKLGQAFQGPQTIAQQQLPVFVDSTGALLEVAPINGTGSITVNASSLVDVGNLSLQNIRNLNLVVAGGDVRGDGTLDVAGNISITAGQVYPTTDTTFTIAAHDHNGIAGNVIIIGSGSRQLPLSAGGTLNVFASNITQGGVLRGPIGIINLGSGVTSSSPVDPLSGQAFDSAQNVTLLTGSITSVSAVDPLTGEDLTIPYGTIVNGVSWLDPANNDITVAGNGVNAVPDKAVNISGVNVADAPGSTIDISGGGDLYAYRFVSGTNGTKDILASTTSFAVIPSYAAKYAPVYSASDYANSSLAVGSQVYLGAGSGLPPGVYTLLPARYALLPGAFLITPTGGAPPKTSMPSPDGSSVVAGYRFNGLDQTRTGTPLLTSFEIDSSAVVRSRAEYDNSSANTFLSQSAAAQGVSVRLPVDAGQLVLAATRTMTIQGAVSSSTPSGGLGSQVDIASPSAILISGPNTDLSSIGGSTLVLDASGLSAFGADSLLIGGYRTSTTAGTLVTVTTNDLTVDNAGAALEGPDVILASKQTLTLSANSDLEQSGTLSSPAETLLLGNANVAGSGDGALVRVSSDLSAQIIRSGLDGGNAPSLVIEAGSTLSGESLTLDSTAATALDSTAHVSGNAVSINSGQISLVLDGSQPTSGLVLSSVTLAGLQASAKALSLLSYSSIDIYEDGVGAIGAAANSTGVYQVQSFALHANEIRGFDGGTVVINAQTVALDNSVGGVAAQSGASTGSGILAVNADTIQLGGGSGVNTLKLDGYADVNLNASGGVLITATKSAAKDSSGNAISGAASFVTTGDLQITTPLITDATGAHATLASNGALTINAAANPSGTTVVGGLGATLNLTGSSVTENSTIQLPSGNIAVEATGTGGNVTVGGNLNVSGTAQAFNDLTKYTSGGQVSLKSDSGSVVLNSGSTVNVSANSDGGNAGSITISAAEGTFQFAGATISGRAGAGGQGGSFTLDVGHLASLAPLEAALESSIINSSAAAVTGFTNSQSIRVRQGDVAVDVAVKTASFNLSTDQGAITVTSTGNIDASNVAATDSTGAAIQVGGSIDLEASGSVTLESGAALNASAQNFSNAGKGGSVTIEAGSEINGSFNTSAVVDIQSGSTIDLRVADNTGTSAAAGDFTGTLHIRAPQTSNATDLQVNAINGTILGASNIGVEGYALFNASSDGSIDNQEPNVLANGQTFAGNTAAILSRIYQTNANAATLQAATSITPGAEIYSTGDLTLASDWDLSTYRFGPNADPTIPGSGTPGVLTLRAAGNLIFQGSLSDGFNGSGSTATLLLQNTTSPANAQSWSYRLVAGSDLAAADFHQVLPATETYDPATGLSVGTATGSLELGNFVTQNNGNAEAADKSSHYQVIRTGTGDIDIATAGDVLLQNQFATIYTAGVAVDPTLGGAFDKPILKIGVKTYYAAQYSVAGGNVSIAAQGNIAHITEDSNNVVVLDSEKELPNNWLYRRGYVDQNNDATAGQFGATKWGDIASTSWWVDFSNFFEGVGALGGGNVTLTAGHDVSNVDAVAPTNARVTKQTSTGDLLAADQTLVELGGGNVLVQAGNDINGGAYYVERGQGTLMAGDSLITNYTRSASLGTLTVPSGVNDPATWLPTTLFLGKGSFDVSAQNDLLLGPVSNPFLLPQGVNNTYWDKTYFSTYATTDAVNVTSLTGAVTLREEATLDADATATPILFNWLQSVDLVDPNGGSVSNFQPWLSLTETKVDPFATLVALSPGTLRATSYTGDINTVGDLTLVPSPTGTVDLLAGGSVNSLQPNGVSNVILGAGSVTVSSNTTWSSSTINLSDANPAAIPGVYSPYAYETVVGTLPAAAFTDGHFVGSTPVQLDFSFINDLFAESGSTAGTYAVLQTKLKLHAAINNAPLHANDADPIHIYASDGDISGLTLFSGKAARVVASQDITDIGLYVQNDNVSDVSLVSAGRDIVAYDANSPLRVAAQATGNVLNTDNTVLSGDIQISGPGTLEVLAGRDLNLGVGPNNIDGTGVGISSIGQERNPVLPFGGADIVALAGVGGSTSSQFDLTKLDFSDANHTGFTDLFLDPAYGGAESERYLPDLGALMALPTGTSTQDVWAAFQQKPIKQQNQLALGVFYLVLRDAGRDHNTSSAPGASTYAAGYAAIAALFPGQQWQGNISLTAREIKTTSGGNISLLAPGGRLDVGLNIAGTQAIDQGILTEDGGNISIFTDGDVNVGTSRIFTLNGGDEVIWSTQGDIAAGASSKTVQSAPPTRVLIDPQSGAVQTDLAGLATGGGIGTLETKDKNPSNVDLIAPSGTVNAGDAGIRASGNLSIAAVQVLNAGNIQVGGKSSGVPTTASANVAGLASASNAVGATANAADQAARAARAQSSPTGEQDIPSIISVEVLGYGG